MGIEIAAPGTNFSRLITFERSTGPVGLKRVLGQSSDFLDAVCCQNQG
jgi:hypothetical protein